MTQIYCISCVNKLGEGSVNGKCADCVAISKAYTWKLDDAAPMGWMCPRCGAVHAPFVAHCDCHPGHIDAISTSEVKGTTDDEPQRRITS